MHLYLRDAAQQLRSAYLSTPDVQPLVDRVLAAVAHDRSPLDLFSGLETHVMQRLANDKFPQFLASEQYRLLCAAIRDKRELPLGEVLVSPRCTRFLERYLQTREAGAVGNLRFWVDVQTSFLPLIQTTLFSVALFEEIQANVRRIYNTYFTASSSSAATLLSEDIRKETLKKIMLLQGEAFSPPRYASLFRRAQEKVWEWLQSDVYPAFRRTSPLYVLLVVEIENLESDKQLRRLSEQVHATGASAALKRSGGEPKSSAIVVPVVRTSSQADASAQSSLDTTSTEQTSFERTLLLETLEDAFGLTSVSFHSVADVLPVDTASVSPKTSSEAPTAATKRFTLRYDLVCSTSRHAAAVAQHLVRCKASCVVALFAMSSCMSLSLSLASQGALLEPTEHTRRPRALVAFSSSAASRSVH